MSNRIALLYVDDEPINLQLFEINFGDRYTVYTAESGFDGLEILKSKNDIRIVLSDLKMPGMNGFEFICKAQLDFPNIPYIIITGFDITPEIAQALKNKTIKKYLCKPFSYADIVDAIEESLK
jgi:CheY-like chemotaxis protein